VFVPGTSNVVVDAFSHPAAGIDNRAPSTSETWPSAKSSVLRYRHSAPAQVCKSSHRSWRSGPHQRHFFFTHYFLNPFGKKSSKKSQIISYCFMSRIVATKKEIQKGELLPTTCRVFSMSLQLPRFPALQTGKRFILIVAYCRDKIRPKLEH
jgi:hypothetical protein